MHEASLPPPARPILWGIGISLLLYLLLVGALGPESLSLHRVESTDAHAHGDTSPAPHGEPTKSTEPRMSEGNAAPADQAKIDSTQIMAVFPFVILLGAIAILPLISATADWWESNRNRLLLSVAMATIALTYYWMLAPDRGSSRVIHVLSHAVLGEYVPFIVLLFSLYTISGGIRIQGDLAAKPLTNASFLAVGGALASFVGTTGAAMLLIRSLIDTNHERKHIQHTVVFFIFVVCNCGGCLLPIGDPPLFLGYLKGVDFMWTMRYLWWPWLLANALIIAVYVLLDHYYFYPRESLTDRFIDEKSVRKISVSGLWPNFPLLIGVIASIAFLDPNKTLPGTEWHPWPFLREAVQLLMVFGSLAGGSQSIRANNKFNYHAILEVAALFIGIFICMQPALDILHVKGAEFGIDTPRELFWATGALSAVLDNAPTYVVFFETAAAEVAPGAPPFHQLVSGSTDLAIHARQQLVGISLGAVFLGAMTYIGNGPNFMVRAIAEQSGVKMPSFFGYVFRYSLLILLPIFFLVSSMVLP